MRHFSSAAVAAVSAFAFVQIASAADMPVKAPVYKEPAGVVSAAGYYFWLDGMYEQVNLPNYGAGLQNALLNSPFTDTGSRQTFSPRLNGGGVRGALGYVVPGTSLRFELGGSYVAASGTTTQTTGDPNSSLVGQLLNGSLAGNGFNCISGAFGCSTLGTLNTNYDAWQINGKVATDLKYGSVTVTPSAALFGGNSHANQSLFQSFRQTDTFGVFLPVGGLLNAGSYAANTSLRWADFGARLGVDLNVEVARAFTVGIGGWVGGVDRNVSLSGTDAATPTTPFTLFNGASSFSTSASRGVVLANLEAGVAYRMTSAVTLRGFAGLNYDGSVPGIASPRFSGAVFAPTSTTPASISYAQETSYYAGGGLVVRFGN
jgi:hypothetical protein